MTVKSKLTFCGRGKRLPYKGREVYGEFGKKKNILADPAVETQRKRYIRSGRNPNIGIQPSNEGGDATHYRALPIPDKKERVFA